MKKLENVNDAQSVRMKDNIIFFENWLRGAWKSKYIERRHIFDL